VQRAVTAAFERGVVADRIAPLSAQAGEIGVESRVSSIRCDRIARGFRKLNLFLRGMCRMSASRITSFSVLPLRAPIER